MSNKTPIQWTHSTCNPSMGCDGCELWPNPSKVRSELVTLALSASGESKLRLTALIGLELHPYEYASQIFHDRIDLALKLESLIPEVPSYLWLEKLEQIFKCYAGILHIYRGGKPADWSTPSVKGHAAIFEKPELFPGRVAKSANLPDLRGKKAKDSPWLDGLPRLIFLSDMGDALSRSISFDYLKAEIIDNVTSPQGQRHIWLWLTKRPKRMAEFARWLESRDLTWPDNLVAMTTITNQKTSNRIANLRQVPAKVRGLSIEPLWEDVALDLQGIDWAIVGGESGKSARPFDLSWARSLLTQCHQSETAFFMKQLGANIVDDGYPLTVRDRHGGNWEEWPCDLRVREFPQSFHDDSLIQSQPEKSNPPETPTIVPSC
ncbi:DUF5131 family protein [Roseibacillus persicicus]|uniref:DUF5131 family protein n=1 Tax=Roseibacillus persicicus TaxID=454148 RepID=UPI00280C6879|nr:DUF5131 family protein [Roseibacillus persicicus]MDQ8192449.1 DUF5131 family protein [Roseibacillus persicicus]